MKAKTIIFLKMIDKKHDSSNCEECVRIKREIALEALTERMVLLEGGELLKKDLNKLETIVTNWWFDHTDTLSDKDWPIVSKNEKPGIIMMQKKMPEYLYRDKAFVDDVLKRIKDKLDQLNDHKYPTS
jgi:hypothetical protein